MARLFGSQRMTAYAQNVKEAWPTNATGRARPFMKLSAFILLFAACAAPPPPAPTPAPPPPAPVAAPQPPAKTPIGSGRVNASTLNVRSEPSMQGDVIG